MVSDDCPAHLLDSSFRALAEQAPVMLWVSNADGHCMLLNRGWRHFRGISVEGAPEDGWSHGMHPDDRAGAVAGFVAAHSNRQPFTAEYRVRRADGEYRWVHDHGTPYFAADGRFLGQMGCSVDITEQRGDDWPAADAERRLKQLVEQSQDLVFRARLGPPFAVEYVGGAVQAITGHVPEEFYADPLLAHRTVHPEDSPMMPITADEAARMSRTMTFRWVHPDGRVVWAEHFRTPVFDAAGRLVAIEGIVRDITDRVEGNRRLRESEEQLRQLAAHLQSAREEERAEVSRELHDELGQTLTALKLEVNRAVVALQGEGLGRPAVDRLQSIVGLVDVGIATVKRISTRLRPATLDHLGLAEAIRWEAATFKARTGLRCQVRTNRTQTRLTAEQQTALFRILQEALTNVVRHAQASSVQVTLAEDDDRFELRIRDNGRGVTAEQATDPRAIGLLGMRERAALIGGEFRISGQRGKGTVVSVHVPLTTHGAVHRPRTQAEPQLG
jgi:PAS domain S-box-containing protein